MRRGSRRGQFTERHLAARLRGSRETSSLVLALATLAGCGAGAGAELDLRGSAPSLDALAGEVIAGLATADTARLERVGLDEREHNDLVWPQLPAADPEANFPVDLAWRSGDREPIRRQPFKDVLVANGRHKIFRCYEG